MSDLKLSQDSKATTFHRVGHDFLYPMSPTVRTLGAKTPYFFLFPRSLGLGQFFFILLGQVLVLSWLSE